MPDVYFNSTKKTFSVRHKGKVIQHADFLIVKDAQFVVNQKGRDWTVKHKRKTVHAVIRGNVTTVECDENGTSHLPYNPWLGEGVSYNPYTAPHFYRRADNSRVDTATDVVLRVIGGRPTITAYGAK